MNSYVRHKTIAIIEATSEMGSAITRSLSKSPKLRLLLVSDDHSRLRELRTEIAAYKSDDEVCATGCAREAPWAADIIVVATRNLDEKSVADKIRDFANGKVVISTSNPMVDAYYNCHRFENTSAAEELQNLLPLSKVVKAFNTMVPNDFTAQHDNEKLADVFISGDSNDAVETVSEVVTSAGFNSVVVGDLAVSRELERTRVKLILHKLKEYNWLGIGRHYTL